MEHDRELLAALEEHKKDMKSLREVVESLRKDLQGLTAAVTGLSEHLGRGLPRPPTSIE